MQLARRSQNTLTSWTHFQKDPHQPSSLTKEAKTHSLPGHIFRRSPISHPTCQKKPEHTHSLDTFSRSLISHQACQKKPEHSLPGYIFRKSPLAIQLARRSQNTLTSWIHFPRSLISHPAWQKKPEHTDSLDTFSEGASSALPEEARTHSLSGHIFRWSLISHPACQKKARTHSLSGHIFRRSLISHAACQKKPEHTHSLDTFTERASSTIQLAQRTQNTLTSWMHFQRKPHQLSSLPEEARTHSLPGHIFRESQKKPEHTHSLETFSEGVS